jgi:hypothetical protein
LIGNLEDYNYFVDQSSIWQAYSRLEENITHIVRKGIFMEDGDVEIDDIVLTLCGLFHYGEPNMSEFDVDWYNSWTETGACEQCFAILVSDEFKEWLVGNKEKVIEEMMEKKEDE